MADGDGRKTHITRIVGTNKAGHVLQDMWVDVERIDKLFTYTQSRGTDKLLDPPNQYQEVGIFLNWNNAEETNSREYETIKIYASEDGDEPAEWVPLQVIKRISFTDSGKEVHMRFDLDSESDPGPGRKVRRIFHYDTNVDAAAQDAFDHDPSLKSYDVKGEYETDGKTKDTAQFIDQEIIDYYERTDSNYFQTNSRDQGTTVKLRNDHLKGEEREGGGGKPYRLDPFQNIINVQLGGLAVEFDDNNEAKSKVESNDTSLPHR